MTTIRRQPARAFLITNPYGACGSEDGVVWLHQFEAHKDEHVRCVRCGGILEVETHESLLRRLAAERIMELGDRNTAMAVLKR